MFIILTWSDVHHKPSNVRPESQVGLSAWPLCIARLKASGEICKYGEREYEKINSTRLLTEKSIKESIGKCLRAHVRTSGSRMNTSSVDPGRTWGVA
jgi:hypothetical protein